MVVKRYKCPAIKLSPGDEMYGIVTIINNTALQWWGCVGEIGKGD